MSSTATRRRWRSSPSRTEVDASWAWAAGMAMGGFCGVLLGQWLTWLLLRNPLRPAVRAYREVWRDVLHLCATGQLRPGR